MKTNYIKLIISIYCLIVLSQAYSQTTFHKQYNEDQSYGVLIEKASNGDTFFVSDSFNENNAVFRRIMVQRLDANGVVLISRALTVEGGYNFYLDKLLATSDNGLLVILVKTEPLTDDDFVNVIKLDASGNLTWSKEFQIKSDIHLVNDAIETSSGDFIILGEVQDLNVFKSSVFLMKLNASGNKVWSRIIDSQLSGAFLLAGGIVEDSNQDLWVSSSTRFNSEGSWVAKLDDLGLIQSVTFYDTHDLTDSQPEPFGMFTRANGDRDIFYNSTSFQDGSMLLNLRTDAAGVPILTKVYTLPHINGGDIEFVKPIGGDGYLFSGYHFPDGINANGVAFQIDAMDAIIWSKEYGSDYIELTTGIVPTSDNGFMLGGFADFDEVIISPSENGLFPWLFKTDSSGTTECYSNNLAVTISDVTTTSASYQLNDVAGPDIVVSDWNNNASTDVVVDVECPTASINDFEHENVLMHPNPADELFNLVFQTRQTNIVVSIRDILGKLVFEKEYSNQSTITIDNIFPSGVYLISIRNDNGQQRILKLIKK